MVSTIVRVTAASGTALVGASVMFIATASLPIFIATPAVAAAAIIAYLVGLCLTREIRGEEVLSMGRLLAGGARK
jgi:hypothetical protein